MTIRQLISSLLLLGLAGHASAAGTVQLDLVGDLRGSAMVFQEWSQVLGKAGIQNVRLRAAADADNVGIETQGTADSPIYVVTGKVVSRDELLLPSGQFHRGDVARLAQWLKDLAEHGPTASNEKKAAFGLSAAAFDRVRQDLAAPVGFVTQGMTARQIAEKIVERLKQPPKLDGDVARALDDEKVGEELIDLSRGTALAYVLRSAGYGLLPRELAFEVVKDREDLEVWPVGWPLKKPAQQALPALFEFHNVNVQNISAAVAIEAIAKQLKTPVLFDHRALARRKIDPTKAKVSLPRSRTTYSLSLRKLLFQASMKFEVRYDDADTPFLWITSLKPA